MDTTVNSAGDGDGLVLDLDPQVDPLAGGVFAVDDAGRAGGGIAALEGASPEGGDVGLVVLGGAVAHLDGDEPEPAHAALADGEVDGPAAADHVQIERAAGVGAADQDGVAVGRQPG